MRPPGMVSAGDGRVLPAIAMMVGAVSSFALVDATAKILIDDLSVFQILWVRFVIFLFLVALIISPRRWPGLMAGPKLGLQIFRGFIPMLAAGILFVALKTMDLADATALFFASPFFLTILSVLLLKEDVGWHRWGAIIVGFVGVVIVARPGSGVFGWVAALPLVAAFFYSLFQITTRMLAAHANPQATLIYSGIIGASVTAFIMPFVWIWPTPMQWGLLAFGGLLNLVIHSLLIAAFARAPAAVLSPFNYIQILAAVIVGYLIFDDVPDVWASLGICVIVSAGLYMVYRERMTVRH